MKIALPILLLLASALSSAAGDLKWINDDYDKALALAKKSGRLLHVDWTADWCGWCKRLESETFSNAEVQKLLTANFVLSRMDKDKFADLATKLGVGGIPALLFIDGDGRIVGRLVGYRPPEVYLLEIAKMLRDHKKLTAAEAKIAKDARDGNAHLAAGDFWAMAEGAELAEKHYAEAEAFYKAAIDSAKDGAVDAWWGLLQVHLGRRNLAGVREASAKLREADPKNGKGHNDNAGVAEGDLLSATDPTAARAAYDKVMSEFPKTDGAIEALFSKGVLLANADKDLDGAIAMLKKVPPVVKDSDVGARAALAIAQLESAKKLAK